MRTFIGCPIDRTKQTNDLLTQLESIVGITPVRTPELHITLHFVGETTDRLAKHIANSLTSIHFPGFQIRMDSLGCFPSERRPRVLFINAREFKMDLYQKVMELTGFQKPREEFVPHITLARIHGTVDIQRLMNKYAEFSFGNPRIQKLCYYRSELKPSGPVYTEIASVQLM